MNAKALLKDVGFGLVIGAIAAVIVIRCIELYSRSHFAATDVSAEQWVPPGRADQPCVAGFSESAP